MKKRYNKIMDKIAVSSEMRKRILQSIDEFDFTNTNQAGFRSFFTIRKYLPLAACLVILLTSLFALFNTPFMTEPLPPILNELQDNIVEMSSLQELASTVDFTIEDISEFLPFTPTETHYTSYWAEMAEITFNNEKQSVVFRKSPGQEDNSGDYNDYDNVQELKINEHYVSLKGNGDSYFLACWFSDEYSYSLSLSQALSSNTWNELLNNILQDNIQAE